ncbi:helix-turn-helix domain-containing protein [Actinorugispora endophytica]|uniref:Transposase n=1 Tax=Actinorugispora endophytica TaxID=1605990 RepID=A0A4V6PWW0_9ACTN|nr:helix-turn-helix domain-containing protein [Actinorugispora endophytica]TDQ53349.1 hypothetical protein EV190_104138 [Actinorugispora endophytica]
MGRRGYPVEFRRKVLDLVQAGRGVADVAHDLDIGTEKTEPAAANKRIAELEAEPAIHCRASEPLGKVVSPKDGSRRSR